MAYNNNHKHHITGYQNRGETKMNANTIISDEMTLDEKLAAIDAAMSNAIAVAADKSSTAGITVAADPADLTMCLGCQ